MWRVVRLGRRRARSRQACRPRRSENTSRTRSNYTLHSSSNGGASWDFVNRVYGGGAGYSDAIVVPDPAAPGGETLLMAFQKTFTPPVAGIEGGGYDVGLARLPL